MKKVALSLLALALVGGAAVAQDAPTLKLSGYLNTGVGAYAAGEDTNMSLYGDDAGVYGARFQINGSYANGNSGVNFRLRTDNITASPTIKYGYAWTKFADQAVVKAGIVDDGTVTTTGDIGADIDTTGVWVGGTVAPGFAYAAALTLDKTNVKNTGALTPAAQVAYTLDKVFGVQAGAIYNAQAAKVTTVNLGYQVLAVPGLTFKGDAVLANLNVDKGAYYKVDQVAAYALSPALALNWMSYEYIYGDNFKNVKGDTQLGYWLRPSVSYVVDAVTSVEGQVKYGTGDQGSGAAAGVANDAAFVEVKPIATFQLSPSAKIITSYALDYSLDKAKLGYGSKGEQVAHVIKADFRYNF